MNEQVDIISKFCKDAKYYMVKFDVKHGTEFGKILSNDEMLNIDLSKYEIHRSTEFKSNDILFVHDLKPILLNNKTMNPLQLLLSNLEEAKMIEIVYPNIFKWVYDGLGIKAYAIVNSNNPIQNSTLSRYGGTQNFIKILNQHLMNIRKMHRGLTPDYNFLNNNWKISDTELALGSINMFTKMYCIDITLDMDYKDILLCSKTNVHSFNKLNTLNMKYWAREINPDFISEATHMKLDKALSIDNSFNYYPPCITNLMALKHKGNYNRFLLARFLLSTHKPHDAKFIFNSIMGDAELEHLKDGNCSGQWNYVQNNMKNYSCPTCVEMKKFCDVKCELIHPLELIQDKLNGESDDGEKAKPRRTDILSEEEFDRRKELEQDAIISTENT